MASTTARTTATALLVRRGAPRHLLLPLRHDRHQQGRCAAPVSLTTFQPVPRQDHRRHSCSTSYSCCAVAAVLDDVVTAASQQPQPLVLLRGSSCRRPFSSSSSSLGGGGGGGSGFGSQSGTVKFYLRDKGYGFITPDNGNHNRNNNNNNNTNDVFVHRSGIATHVPIDVSASHPFLRKGERVRFDTVPDTGLGT